MPKSKWTRQPQEVEGQDYWFAGRAIMTARVNNEVPEDEVREIIDDIKKFVQEQKGIDYLQSFINEETGKKVWVIDQVTKTALENGSHPPAHNYFTILFPEEY